LRLRSFEPKNNFFSQKSFKAQRFYAKIFQGASFSYENLSRRNIFTRKFIKAQLWHAQITLGATFSGAFLLGAIFSCAIF